ncbi:helix-turn-helix domain-containing protein [Methylobacterium sp. E-065]|uniref:helix-turn-helix domain-containing protein n=1 Tax=Methylobacterium sp. E-065 TaxID=2836583 RepID=UPI001FB9FC2D|nr:helix-turn-helix transcriptional regulator [Methylobacterium sp. E-065]MCJ2021445.1 helix-turn-helix domain-containing protein [Methylobacterium sp. E-065]
MDLRQAFGTNVRQHRRAVGMTQEHLAERVEVSIETIGKIERGVAAPSFDTVERIASALQISPLALFGAGGGALPNGDRGRLIAHIQAILADMNEDQMARAAKMLDAFMGR